MHHSRINSPADWQAQLPTLHADSHKYNRGYLMIYGGYPITGAARLAAIAAARTGAGMTVIAVPEIAFSVYASQCLSIMIKPYTHARELRTLLNEPRIHAYLIGPGAGVSTTTLAYTLTMLDTHKPVVIDADALGSLDGQPEKLRLAIQGPCVLTPHDGEFKKLFGKTAGETLASRIESTQHAAKTCNATLLLKGSQTVIASPDGRVLINQNAPATLATAGAGDVLAGIIASLLAQGMPAFEAAAAAAWIHGEAASLFGLGLMAEDLPGLIPRVLNRLSSAADT